MHLALFPVVGDLVPGAVEEIETDWAQLLGVRSAVLVQLESLRLAKEIGKSLDAGVEIIVAEGTAQALPLLKHETALAEFFNVSQASVQAVGASQEQEALVIRTGVAGGSKCERCWRVLPDVGADDRWPGVCGRCAEALEAIGYAAESGAGA